MRIVERKNEKNGGNDERVRFKLDLRVFVRDNIRTIVGRFDEIFSSTHANCHNIVIDRFKRKRWKISRKRREFNRVQFVWKFDRMQKI